MKKNKQIKLMVVTPYFYPKIGGLENYAYNIVKGLKNDYNYKIFVVTSNHEDKTCKEEIFKGMKIYRLPYQFKASNTPISFKWKKQIKEIIEKENPDVINAHSPVPFISDVTARIAHKLKIPFVLTYHNDLFKDNLLLNFICRCYYWFMGTKTLRLSNKIIATSKFYAENSPYLKKHLNKIDIVSPGVYIPKYKEFKKNKNQIIFVGQLDKTHHHKGLNYLIEAVSIVKKEIPLVNLSIVGTGDNIQEYKDQINKLNLTESITFLGRIPNNELSEEYSKSKIVVLPSYTSSEGFGMVLVEGMAHKCVAIGSNIGGIPYVIDNNKNGLLVPPKDPKALAEAIIKLLKNPKLAKKMGEKGYKKVKENFTWDKSIKKTNEILRRF